MTHSELLIRYSKIQKCKSENRNQIRKLCLVNTLRIMLENSITQDNTKTNRKAGCFLCGFLSLLPLGRLQRFSFLTLPIATSCSVSDL